MTQNVENLNTYTYALLIKLQNRKNTKCSKHVWFHWSLQFSMISSNFQVHNFVRVFVCWMEMKLTMCMLSRDLRDAKNAKCSGFLISDQLLKKEKAPTSCGSNAKTIEECGTFLECLTCKTAKIEDRNLHNLSQTDNTTWHTSFPQSIKDKGTHPTRHGR